MGGLPSFITPKQNWIQNKTGLSVDIRFGYFAVTVALPMRSSGVVIVLHPGGETGCVDFPSQFADDARFGLVTHFVQFLGNQTILLRDDAAGLHGLLQKRMFGAVTVGQGGNQFEVVWISGTISVPNL